MLLLVLSNFWSSTPSRCDRHSICSVALVEILTRSFCNRHCFRGGTFLTFSTVHTTITTSYTGGYKRTRSFSTPPNTRTWKRPRTSRASSTRRWRPRRASRGSSSSTAPARYAVTKFRASITASSVVSLVKVSSRGPCKTGRTTCAWGAPSVPWQSPRVRSVRRADSTSVSSAEWSWKVMNLLGERRSLCCRECVTVWRVWT